MQRKDFQKSRAGLIGIAGLLPLVNGCQKQGIRGVGPGSDPGAGGGPGGGTGTTGSRTGSCIVTPTEEEGPFPYPSGEIKNSLQRVDITSGQQGVPLALTFTVVNANSSCAVVSGARVDLWLCNKDGYYSGYSQSGILGNQNFAGQTWLRGYQLTDSSGKALLTFIYPGWYSGRATHVHIGTFFGKTSANQPKACMVAVGSDHIKCSCTDSRVCIYTGSIPFVIIPSECYDGNYNQGNDAPQTVWRRL